MHAHEHGPDDRQPPAAINAPAPVVLLIACFIAIHLARGMITPELDERLMLSLAVVPVHYSAVLEGVPAAVLPAGAWGLLLAPFSHFFLHADWMHLTANSLWMLAFGSVVARRLGGARFLALALLSAAAGAAFFTALHWASPAILVGASGGISGLMGAAIRLIYADGLPLALGIRRDVRHVRALTLRETLTLPGPRQFIVVWLLVNALIGLVGLGTLGEAGRIAWDAHLGGFVAGLLLLGPLDRRPGAISGT